MMPFPWGETPLPQVNQSQKKIKITGDKSPKSNQRKSSQEQAKANRTDQTKRQAVADKPVAGKKK
jgi:hypothetical protein